MISAPQYTVTTVPDPLYITSSLSSVSITFEQKKQNKVPGWPEYMGMGTLTLNTGLSEGTGRPFDAIFKYSGDNGAGDLNRIVYPGPTLGTKKWSFEFSKANNFAVRPVMVHYTLQLSGGTVFDDLTEQNMAKHFINLAHDVILLNEPFNFKNQDYYGSLVINPDALGFIQQQNLYENALKGMTFEVNKAIAKMSCFLNLNVSFKGFSGSPIEIAKQIGITWVDPEWTSQADIWFNSCVNNYRKVSPSVPTFTNNFKGWIKATNWVSTYYGPNIAFGWHENISMLPSGSLWVLQNNANKPTTSDYIQNNVTNPTLTFLNLLGVYDNDYRPHFLAFDRYERDDTEDLSYYFYNDSCWKNVITLCKQVSKGLMELPIMLWQMPGGHIQTTNDVDKRNGHGGAFGNFLFGDKNLQTNLSNVKAYWNNLPNLKYCNEGKSQCTPIQYLKENNYDYSLNQNNINLLQNSGIFSILFGGGTGPTTGINVYPSDDGGWLSSKIVDYYKSIGVLAK